MKTIMKKQERGTAGFTLIELLIAIGIFAIFITIITGIFTNFMQVQRHAIAQGQLISDITSSLESFIKEARTGYGSTYNSNGSNIAFVNQNGNCVAYRSKEIAADKRNEFQRAERLGAENCTPESFAAEEYRFTPITSNVTSITVLTFAPTIALDGNNDGILDNQGVIKITLTATSKKDGIPPITIQNSVTSRQMEPYAQK